MVSRKKSRKASRKRRSKRRSVKTVGYFVKKGRVCVVKSGRMDSAGHKVPKDQHVYKKKSAANKALRKKSKKKSRKSRQKYGGNKGDQSRSRRDYRKKSKKKSKRKSKKKSKRKSRKKSKRKSRKSRQKYGGNKGDQSRSRRDYRRKSKFRMKSRRRSRKRSRCGKDACGCKSRFRLRRGRPRHWGSMTPSSSGSRRELYRRKKKCYLVPPRGRYGRPKYPVCAVPRKDGRWDFNRAKRTRRGILAAYARAATQMSMSAPGGAHPNKKVHREASRAFREASKLRNRLTRAYGGRRRRRH